MEGVITLNNLDWFDRVYTNLEDELYETCDIMKELIENGCLSITSSEAEKHPSIHVDYSYDDLEYDGETITIYFDPYNQEFYAMESDEQVEIRVMFKTLDDIINFIHHSIHEACFDGLIGDGEEKFPFFHSEEGHKQAVSVDEGLTPNEIKWLTEEIVTAEETFNEPTEHVNIVSYRLGKAEPDNQLLLVRFDTIFVNGQQVSKQGAVFPFNKSDVIVIQKLLNASIYNE